MTPIFLIVDPDAYVADDLSEIIRETVRGAQVIHAPMTDDHTMRIVDEMAIYGVFLGGFPDDEATRDFVTALARRRVALARIGRTGDRRFTFGGPDSHIESPFTGGSVASVITAWTRARPLSGIAPRPDDGTLS